MNVISNRKHAEFMQSTTSSKLTTDFLRQYSTEESIRKYSKRTAGTGISYLLDHDYGRIYLNVIENYLPKSRIQRGLRIWEFGCAAGMNLLHLVSSLELRGIAVDRALGTDFSKPLIAAAEHEAETYLISEQKQNVRFCVARNENLIDDVSKALGLRKEALLGSFDVLLGVNTIRYCYRLKNEGECAEAIFNLLAESGVCIIIDMNQKFPAFRSRFRDRLTKDKTARYLPSLDEYARPFSCAGFEILRKQHFCWIPHSAGPRLTAVMRASTPLLNALVPSHAMRSLVISQKPAERRT